jgi:hypothetical protein
MNQDIEPTGGLSEADTTGVPTWPAPGVRERVERALPDARAAETSREAENTADGEAVLREARSRHRRAAALKQAAERLASHEHSDSFDLESAATGSVAVGAGEVEATSDAETAPTATTTATTRTTFGLPEELKSFTRWLGRLSSFLLRSAFEGGRFAAGTLSTYVIHHPVHFVLNVVLTVAMLVLLATGAALNEELIAQRLADRTAEEIAAVSRFTRSYSLADIDSRGSREFMRAGAPSWMQHESIKAIIEGSREAGLSLEHQSVLLATAEIESGFNPMARAATTSACGIFQFVKATGAAFGLKDSDCFDPWKSTEAEIAHYRQNYERRIEERVAHVEGPERLLRMFELSYYLHHDGPLSKDPSDEVKATVLAGTPFLFKVYEVLEADEEYRRLEPTFVDRFRERFDSVVAQARVAPGEVMGPVLAWLRPGEEALRAENNPQPDAGEAADATDSVGGDAAAEKSAQPAPPAAAVTDR